MTRRDHRRTRGRWYDQQKHDVLASVYQKHSGRSWKSAKKPAAIPLALPLTWHAGLVAACCIGWLDDDVGAQPAKRSSTAANTKRNAENLKRLSRLAQQASSWSHYWVGSPEAHARSTPERQGSHPDQESKQQLEKNAGA